METYSTGISKKIIMEIDETQEIVDHINDWAINRINELDGHNKQAIIDEFYEWINDDDDMGDDNVEIVSLNFK